MRLDSHATNKLVDKDGFQRELSPHAWLDPHMKVAGQGSRTVPIVPQLCYQSKSHHKQNTACLDFRHDVQGRNCGHQACIRSVVCVDTFQAVMRLED
mmetsp:Transcript_69267/g.133658  ORF Transcript_69267/g.133658 Transcript_69267/m.133658 type:complete len:97 (+) Transcript_69267:34-324(+)